MKGVRRSECVEAAEIQRWSLSEEPEEEAVPTSSTAESKDFPISPFMADPVQDRATLDLLMELNQYLATTGEAIEGNVCYWDGTSAQDYSTALPISDPDHVCKRANLATLARRQSTMLEIGLNGGHSALICLAANPALHLFSVDIMQHVYTNRAVEFLQSKFRHRFHFAAGDSREVLPKMAVNSPSLRFDLLHVDGGHGADLAYTDLSNSLRMARTGGVLVFDDVNAPHLGDVLKEYVRMGYLHPFDGSVPIYSNQLHAVMVVA